MKIALSTDHAGFESLQQLKAYLELLGHECADFGPTSYNPDDDYPDFITPAAQAVARGDYDAGIIFGGSGQGEAIAANRVEGIRCGVFYGKATVQWLMDAEGHEGNSDGFDIIRLNRQHNNANMLSLAGRFLTRETVEQAARIWLETPFSGEERHQRRIQELDQ